MLPCSHNPHFYEESSEYDGKKLIVTCQFINAADNNKKKDRKKFQVSKNILQRKQKHEWIKSMDKEKKISV